MKRSEQRDETRRRIVEAAIEVFAARGYGASSTRDIAARAGTTQGLLTYHFSSKDALWRAAADTIFSETANEIPEMPNGNEPAAFSNGAREGLRRFVRQSAARPAMLRFMIDAGSTESARTAWLVETHLAPRFALFDAFAQQAFPSAGRSATPHLYYALAGAAALIFTVAPECGLLAALDPLTPEAITRHADLIADLFVPA